MGGTFRVESQIGAVADPGGRGANTEINWAIRREMNFMYVTGNKDVEVVGRKARSVRNAIQRKKVCQKAEIPGMQEHRNAIQRKKIESPSDRRKCLATQVGRDHRSRSNRRGELEGNFDNSIENKGAAVV
jgi:hypothetical protein